MNTYIKLTREDGTTRYGMTWEIGKTNRAAGGGTKLCTDGVLHVYDTPEQAAFMRPIHCDSYTRAWEVGSRCKGVTDGTKRGIKSCTVVREIELPQITIEQRVEIAIRVSLSVYQGSAYVEWAQRWLSGEDRSKAAANAAAAAAARAAAYAAAYAADAAAYAARAAAYAAYAVDAAVYTAYAVGHAIDAAGSIDLQSIIEEVLG